MRRVGLNLLLILALAISLSPAAWVQPQPAAAASSEPPAAPPAFADRTLPPHLEEVPADIQALFADGMSAADFVAMSGYVPRALEGIVEGDALMVIELEGDPVAVQYAAEQGTLRPMSVGGIDLAIARLETAQAQLEPQLVGLGVQIISTYKVAYNGFQARVPLSRLNEIRALPGVKAVHRAPIHEPTLGTSVNLIGASQVWEDLGFDGDGITIAIIDTGIDYTHAAFGGPGNPLAYSLNNPNVIESNTFPTAKVIAGYDFAGTLYDADCATADETAGICTATPQPDPDPLDEHYHGTHVASIAAGFAAGDVMTGTAPGATLMALKVFGRDGTTSLTMDALEWATLQYLFTGKPNVINMSLGSNFGTGDPVDPDVLASNNAAGVGIVVVASAGNASDNSYITGSPGSADRVISVAASEDGFSILDGFEVTEPLSLEGVHPGLQSVNYDWTSTDLPITGTLVYPEVGANPARDQRTGCYTFNITNTAMIAGNVVLLDWDTPSCGGSVARSANAVAAGAIGVLMVDDSDVFDLYIGGSAVVPAYSIPLPIGDALKAALGTGAVEVVLTAELAGSVPYSEPAAEDIIAEFSSRGPRGTDSFLKPEITAPGGSIFAANAGTGVGGLSIGGTSMAAPHIAGVAALMVQANPTWTPEEVKAAMMNTAVDLKDGTPIPISGAGRVDAYRAADTEVVAIGDEDLVSLSFGVGFTRNDAYTRTKQVTVHNWGAAAVTYDVAADFQDGSWETGITLDVDPVQVVVPAGGSADVEVTLSVDMTQIPVLYPGLTTGLEEVFGFVTFTPTDPDDALRLPFYFQPRPYSQLELEADTVIFDPATDMAVITMTHRGPITSSTWIYPALVWNATPDDTMAGPGDVRLFGMDYLGGGFIGVAINSWDYWHVPQPYFAEFDLYIDADQDGVDDYLNFNFNMGWATGGGNDNVWVVIQVDLATGKLYLGSPYTIYTDYNASYMEWFLPAAWQDLSPTNSAFAYQLVGFDEGGISVNPPGRFDYARSPFMWTITNDPGPADNEALAFVMVNDLRGYIYSAPEGVMVVDYNGDPRNINGGQAYFEPFEITSGFVQVAHLAPFAEDASVTIALNGSPVLFDVGYGDSTGYIPLSPDEYLVEVIPTGTTTVAISATVEVEALGFYTMIATGDGVNQDLALIALEDDLTAPAAGKFHLRLGHLAPFAAGAATADIRLQDGTLILGDVDFGDVTAFIPLDAGEYDLKITTPGGGTTLIDPMPVTFAPGQILSAFATGEGANQDLGVFALPAGETGFFLPLTVYTVFMPVVFRNYTPTYLQVAHLAPFAMDPGTAVTVTLNGVPALTNVAYGDSTGYIEVAADSYLVEIFPAGSAVAAISATVDLAPFTHYTAIATGDGVKQDLALIALEDDLTAPAAGKFHLRLGHLAPFAAGAATADIRLQDGTLILGDVDFGDVTALIPLGAGEYDLKITTPGGGTTLIDPLPVNFAAGAIVSAFATGEGANQDLGVFAMPAGAPGDFLPLATYVQVAHLAPFAVGAGTAVTVTLNGVPALPDFVYGDSTEYIALEQGTYLVEIFPGSSPVAAISATLDLAQATYYTAIATGDGVKQDLALIALEDDLTAPAADTFHLRLGHLAPFAAGTATADIRLQDGTPVLTDVVYSAVTGYIPLPAGEYDLKITTPGGGTTLIDPLPVTFVAGQIVSAFATGDGVKQDLGVFALPTGAVGFFLPQ